MQITDMRDYISDLQTYIDGSADPDLLLLRRFLHFDGPRGHFFGWWRPGKLSDARPKEI